MKLRDTTVEANSGDDMADYYLYHAQSEGDRWAVAVEQMQIDRFHVSVLMKQPDWPVFGVLRYWVFPDRAMAEARYLELQRLLSAFAEDVAMKELMVKLPERDRGGITPEEP
jgi:hypothetical protein